MKKLLLVFVAAITLISCTKQKQQCWQCTMASWSTQNHRDTTKSTHEYCGKTEDEIRQYEKDNTTSYLLGSGLYYYTGYTKTTCK